MTVDHLKVGAGLTPYLDVRTLQHGSGWERNGGGGMV